ncbi:MAG: hypothetical protein ACK5N0_11105 [Synechococcaceae cyanobacterium]
MAAEKLIQGELPLPSARAVSQAKGLGDEALGGDGVGMIAMAAEGGRADRVGVKGSAAGDPAATTAAPLAAASPTAGLASELDCKGIRPTGDFPRDVSGLSPERVAHLYGAMRNSHAALSRSRGQLQRRSRDFRAAQTQFLATLASYEQRLLRIGSEKVEAMRLAEDMHRELEAFGAKQRALDGLLDDLEAAKQQAGFWSVFQINQLLERMRALLRRDHRSQE